MDSGALEDYKEEQQYCQYRYPNCREVQDHAAT